MALLDLWKKLFNNQSEKELLKSTKKIAKAKKTKKVKKKVIKKSQLTKKKKREKKPKKKTLKKPAKKSLETKPKSKSKKIKPRSRPKLKKVKLKTKTKIKKGVFPKKEHPARLHEKKIGTVTHYFGKISVGIIKLVSLIKVGDKIRLKGVHDDFTQKVKSMQINHRDVVVAKRGEEIGIKVSQPVHENVKVYLIP